MISSATDSERVMIGLLGPFGVGKSTVIQLLSEHLPSSGGTVLRISAERHEQAGLHASLIYAFAEQMDKKKLAPTQKITDILDTLQYATSRTAIDFSAAPLVALPASIKRAASRSPRATKIAGAGLVVFALAAVAVGLTRGWNGFTAALAVLTVAAAAVYSAVPTLLLKSISSWLVDLTKQGSRTLQRARVETADEFERTFADLVALSKKRLIIAVDDIDRLSPTEVLVALNAIRSFQLTCSHNQPVFIVSADEGIIETAVRRAQPGPASGPAGRAESAKAFLDRLFTHRQDMPVHAPADLTGFAVKLLQNSNHMAEHLFEAGPRDVVEVLIHDGVEDPRHAIRILNAFFGDYRLAWQRERQSDSARSIASGVVTNEPRFLARLSVLKLDFPRFHQSLFHDEQYLTLLESHIEGSRPLEPAEIRGMGYDKIGTSSSEDDDEWSALRIFVGRTASVRPVADLRPFLYLGQGDLERVVGGAFARQVRTYLTGRQIVDFSRAVEETAAKDDGGAQMQALVELVRETVRRSSAFELQNVIPTLLTAVHQLPANSLSDIAVEVANAFRNGVPSPRNTAPVFTLAMAAPEPHIRFTLAERVLDPGPEGPTRITSLLVVRQRGELAQILGAERVSTRIAAALEDLGTRSPDAVDDWLQQLESTPLPDMADRVIEAAVRVLLAAEEDLPDHWRAPLERHFVGLETSADPTTGCPLTRRTLEAASALLRVDLSSAISQFLLKHMVDYSFDDEWTTTFIDVLRAGSLDAQGDVFLTDFPALPLTLRLLSRFVDHSSIDAVSLEVARMTSAYAGHAVSQGAGLAYTSTVRSLMRTNADLAESPVRELVDAWSQQAREDGRGGDALDGLLELLPQLTQASRDHIEVTLLTAVQASSPALLSQASIKLFHRLAQTGEGRSTLTKIARQQAQQVQYGSSSLSALRPVWRALYDVVHFPESLTSDVINRYAQLPQYGGDWARQALGTLTSVEWPDESMPQVVQVLASQQQHMVAVDYWALASQLAHSFVTPPDALLPGLKTALIAHGSDTGGGRAVVLGVGAQLPPAVAMEVALRIVNGDELVAQMPDPTGGPPFASLITTLLNDEAAVRSLNTVAVIESLHGADGPRYAENLGIYALEHIDRQWSFSALMWECLLKPTDDAMVSQLRLVATKATQTGDWGGVETLFTVAVVEHPQYIEELLIDAFTDFFRSGPFESRVAATISRVIATSATLRARAYREAGKVRRSEATAAREAARAILKP